ncbi:MAG TPA: prolipoprotein diacylglyceryl transferase family protein [Terracidiphilus sp.]|nr:prolipoprotein diacylglyceryl transferase family protein [Terracidiphilus sp.]
MHPVLIHIGAFVIPSYGAMAAVGVLAALIVAQRTALFARLNPGQIWNLCVIALFAALVAQRLLLIAINMSDLRRHPSWLLTLAMVHHPLLAAVGAAAALVAGVLYARRKQMPLRTTADVLAAPLALGMAFEQFGALLAGSDYGIEAQIPWAVTYTHPLAAMWSGTPLGIPLHPVQAYTAMAFLTFAVFLLVWQPAMRQHGDLAGIWLMGTGVIVFITELWRDPQGRGVILNGIIDGPQLAAIAMVLGGALVLRERNVRITTSEGAHG